MYNWNMWINLKNIQRIKSSKKKIIKHCNNCFKTQKWVVKGVQNFWKWKFSWNLLDKTWHNSINIFF
jgi:hypothetical protein